MQLSPNSRPVTGSTTCPQPHPHCKATPWINLSTFAALRPRKASPQATRGSKRVSCWVCSQSHHHCYYNRPPHHSRGKYWQSEGHGLDWNTLVQSPYALCSDPVCFHLSGSLSSYPKLHFPQVPILQPPIPQQLLRRLPQLSPLPCIFKLSLSSSFFPQACTHTTCMHSVSPSPSYHIPTLLPSTSLRAQFLPPSDS